MPAGYYCGKSDPWSTGPSFDQTRCLTAGSESAASIKAAKEKVRGAGQGGVKKQRPFQVPFPYRTEAECALADKPAELVGRGGVQVLPSPDFLTGHARPRGVGTAPHHTPSDRRPNPRGLAAAFYNNRLNADRQSFN